MKTEWISVSDELPEEEDMYLCHFTDGTIETSLFGPEDEIIHPWEVYHLLVTHWMPLPNPPELK